MYTNILIIYVKLSGVGRPSQIPRSFIVNILYKPPAEAFSMISEVHTCTPLNTFVVVDNTPGYAAFDAVSMELNFFFN